LAKAESIGYLLQMVKARTQKDRREATQALLLVSARALFGAGGYEATSLDAVVAHAGVTKGALYHHFPLGKPQLFEAVVLAEQQALMGDVATQGAVPSFEQKLADYFAAGTDAASYRITMVDAPAVLGRKRWREIEYAHGARLIADEIASLGADLDALKVDPAFLAAALYGAFAETTVMVAEAEDAEEAKAKAIAVMMLLCRL
jgi:AcrR family transcriptional regulator